MPELPEVETVARELAPSLAGRRVLAAELFDPRLGDPPVDRLVGRRVCRVFRLGKQVVLELDGGGRERRGGGEYACE